MIKRIISKHESNISACEVSSRKRIFYWWIGAIDLYTLLKVSSLFINSCYLKERSAWLTHIDIVICKVKSSTVLLLPDKLILRIYFDNFDWRGLEVYIVVYVISFSLVHTLLSLNQIANDFCIDRLWTHSSCHNRHSGEQNKECQKEAFTLRPNILRPKRLALSYLQRHFF